MTEDKLKEAWDLFLKERELSYSSSLNPWEMFKAGYEAGTKQKLLGNEAKATVAEDGDFSCWMSLGGGEQCKELCAECSGETETN